MQVVDRRHTDGKSPTAEVAGFFRGIFESSLRLGADIREVVTDQNLSILRLTTLAATDPEAFIRETKKLLHNFPDTSADEYHHILCILVNGFDHILDVWHRAKNIGKALLKVSS